MVFPTYGMLKRGSSQTIFQLRLQLSYVFSSLVVISCTSGKCLSRFSTLGEHCHHSEDVFTRILHIAHGLCDWACPEELYGVCQLNVIVVSGAHVGALG